MFMFDTEIFGSFWIQRLEREACFQDIVMFANYDVIKIQLKKFRALN